MTSPLAGILAAGIGPFGPWEILLVLFVIVLLFGAKRLPELAKGFGKSIKEFKKATNENEAEEDERRRDRAAMTEEDDAHAAKNGAAKTSAPKPGRTPPV
ncbi:MAG: twin-arginine translocase TatA/TatE family subunit [Opitutaceae bacterium]